MCVVQKIHSHAPHLFSSMFFFVSPDHLGPTHDDDHGVILCAASGARIVTYFFLRGYDRNITHATAMAPSTVTSSRLGPIGTTPTQATRGRSSSARARDRGRSWGSRSSPTRGSSTRRRLLGKKWPSVVGNRCELAEVKIFI